MCSFFSKDKSNVPASVRNSTCCIIKPHAVRKNLTESISYDIQKANFIISKMKLFYVDEENAKEFYEIYKGVSPDYYVRTLIKMIIRITSPEYFNYK